MSLEIAVGGEDEGNESVLEKIKKVLIDRTSADPDMIRNLSDMDRLDDHELGLDSLDIVEMQMSLEDIYNMSFPEDYKAYYFGEIINYIIKHKKQ